MYRAQLIRTMVITTTMAWSFERSALNICETEGESTLTVDFSLMVVQVSVIAITKMIATMRANHLKPALSLPPPRACTHIMVITVIMADPTPAQERASVVRPSRSVPPSVKAGIIDQ